MNRLTHRAHPVTVAPQLPSDVVNSIGLQCTRLHELHKMACTCQNWNRVTRDLFNHLRKLALSRQPMSENKLKKALFPPKLARRLAFDYLCSRLMSHSHQEDPPKIFKFTSNFFEALKSVPAKTRLSHAIRVFSVIPGNPRRRFDMHEGNNSPQ